MIKVIITSNSQFCMVEEFMLNISASFHDGLHVPFLHVDFFFLIRFPLIVTYTLTNGSTKIFFLTYGECALNII